MYKYTCIIESLYYKYIYILCVAKKTRSFIWFVEQYRKSGICFRGLQFLFSKSWNFLFEHNIYLKYDVLVLLKQFIVSHTTWMKILLKKYLSVFQTTPSLIPTHPGRRIVPTTATHARQTVPTPTYWTVRALVSLFNWFPAHWYWYNLHLSPFVEHLMSWILLLMWFTKSYILKKS